MLIRILESIARGHVYSPGSLARQVGVSEGLLMPMVEDLTRRGYLAPLSLDGQGGGGSCGGCSGCKPGQDCPAGVTLDLQGWVLTPKGLETAERHQQ